ncbi:MAG: hypothetical protein WKG03_01795 [Telluria sp.]
MEQLPDEAKERIELLLHAGGAFETAGDFDSALARYAAAFEQVPEPKTDWNVSSLIMSNIGSTFFLKGYFQAGADSLRLALQCVQGPGNSFIHLRLGQVELELDNRAAAIEHLTIAYQQEGEEIFEEENPKYLAFLKKVRPALVG